jgi:peptidoglycan/LPS O-acetylase OafA/YrhL
MAESARFKALDAWRGICAVLIVVFHFIWVIPSSLHNVVFVRNAYLFVDFFFVLSGFVLCHSYRGRVHRAVDLWRFAMKRFGRVWPLHVVVLAAFVAAVFFVNSRSHPQQLALTWETTDYSARAVLPQLFLLNAMDLQGNSWNGPAWSIGAEFYTYLVFAVLLLFAARRLIAVSAVLVVAALTFIFCKAPDLMNTTWDYGFVRCLAGFFAGVIAYHVYERRRWRRFLHMTMREIAMVALVIAFVVCAGAGPDSVGKLSLAAPLVFGAAVVVFAEGGGLLSLFLRMPPLQALGRYSYSIYMIHQPLLIMLCYGIWANGYTTKAFGPAQAWSGSSTLVLADFILAVLLIAAACCHLIERPARARFGRLAERLGENRTDSGAARLRSRGAQSI